MSNDAAGKAGRQIKWKYILLLLLLAAAALWGGWTGSRGHGLDLPRWNRTKETAAWRDMPWGAESRSAALGGGFAVAGGGTVAVLDGDGQTQYTLETGEEALRLAGGGIAAAYGPGGKTLYLLTEDGWSELSFPCGILWAAVGKEDRLAVITTGSGFLTKTEWYDFSGNRLGEYGLTDETMVMGAFARKDQRFFGLCLNTSGRWNLKIFDETGAFSEEISLEDASGCRVLPCGEGAAVLTDTALLFFSGDGQETGRYPLGVTKPKDWRCSERGWAVLILQRGSQSILQTVSMEGRELGQTRISGPVRDVTVFGNTLYALDLQALRVYDKECALLEEDPEGARAAGLWAGGGSLWLLGSGEGAPRPLS